MTSADFVVFSLTVNIPNFCELNYLKCQNYFCWCYFHLEFISIYSGSLHTEWPFFTMFLCLKRKKREKELSFTAKMSANGIRELRVILAVLRFRLLLILQLWSCTSCNTSIFLS